MTKFEKKINQYIRNANDPDLAMKSIMDMITRLNAGEDIDSIAASYGLVRSKDGRLERVHGHPDVGGGKPLPVIEPVAPEDRPGINTVEGRTDLANRTNRWAFVRVFGREPVCDAELRAWEDSNFDEDFQWEGIA